MPIRPVQPVDHAESLRMRRILCRGMGEASGTEGNCQWYPDRECREHPSA